MSEIQDPQEPTLAYVKYIVTDGTYDLSSHTRGVDAFKQIEIFNRQDLEVKVVEQDYVMRVQEETL